MLELVKDGIIVVIINVTSNILLNFLYIYTNYIKYIYKGYEILIILILADTLLFVSYQIQLTLKYLVNLVHSHLLAASLISS